MVVMQDELTTISLDRTQSAQRDAAKVWARATAVRDGRPDLLNDTDRALVGIRRRLSLPDASLHVAQRHERVVGFVVVVPRGATLEITHLAVDPNHWGEGIAGELLAYVDRQARLQQFTQVDLWVIADNARAIDRYERAGFRLTTDVQDSAGRLERRMQNTLY